MLNSLLVKNFALIRDLKIEFGPNANLLTGETGAGKSIILGALNLALGERADTSNLMDDSKKCIIEAEFNISRTGLKAFLEANGLDYEDHTIIRREILPGGKSRAFLNDTPTKLSVLKTLAEKLIDVHSQHQAVSLKRREFHFDLINTFALSTEEYLRYTELYKQYTSTLKELNDQQEKQKEDQRERDYRQFLLDELNDFSPSENDDSLESDFNTLSNAEEIKKTLFEAYFALYEDESSISSILKGIASKFNSIKNYNDELEGLAERIHSVSIELEDIAKTADAVNESLTIDEDEKQHVEERLNQLNKLLSKHGETELSALIQLKEELEESLSQSDNMDREIRELQSELEKLKKQIQELALEHSNKRKEAAPALSNQLEELLRELGIKDASLKFIFEELPEPGAKGSDNISLHFSANKGIKEQPIEDVASGGELSRILFAIKYYLAEKQQMPCLVFDEIDTGISGEITRSMSLLMKEMASRHQLIIITHQAQIASIPGKHLEVYKSRNEERSYTSIKELAEEDRINAIAEMIGGKNRSTSTENSARELLEASKN